MSHGQSGSPFDDAVRRIEELIAVGDLDEAVARVRGMALNGPQELADEAVRLAGRLARLRRDERQSRLTREQAKVEEVGAEAAIQGLLRDLRRKLTSADLPVPTPSPGVPFTKAEATPFEKIIGVNNLKQVAWLEQGVAASRAVCRILTPGGLGTGFLVGPRTVMTNNHVIGSEAEAKGSKAEFGYQVSFGATHPDRSVRYTVGKLIRTDRVADVTLVEVEPLADPAAPSVESWGRLRLNPHAEPVTGEHVVIVQHPNGEPKQIVLTANSVLRVQPPYLHYSTDTMPGSSGSPVFNDLWEVIAIHHAAGPNLNAPGGGVRYSNEGVLMSAAKAALPDDWPA